MSKWTLLERRRTLEGTLTRVSVSSGSAWPPSGWDDDHDTNFHIIPHPGYRHLLENSDGHRNRSGELLGEVQPWTFFRPAYEAWARSLVGKFVTASGVFVEDNNHEHWTELHPVDLVVGRVTSSLSPGDDWIAKAADNWGLVVGVSLYAYRFLAASDTRKGLVFEGPPLWNVTREANVLVDFPPKPGPDWFPVVSDRIAGVKNARNQIEVAGEGNPKLRIVVTCQARGDGGPGIMLGEAVAAWTTTVVT
jgi:hypothetical protein